jgi:hypothetical protein
LVGQRDVNGVKANVFRSYREQSRTSFDVWLDVNTKRLVGFCEPGADAFDLTTAPDRDNPAEKKLAKAELVVTIGSNIVYDAPLDRKLFALTPPEGFEVVQESPRPPVSEAQLIEWLGATARFNDGIFDDTPSGVDREKLIRAAEKDKAHLTEVERKFLDLWRKQGSANHRDPISAFVEENAVPGTFRYIGKGVKLGSSDRIVCWYKLKITGKYRAVYGDLAVKDVDPKDLPLPVKK